MKILYALPRFHENFHERVFRCALFLGAHRSLSLHLHLHLHLSKKYVGVL